MIRLLPSRLANIALTLCLLGAMATAGAAHRLVPEEVSAQMAAFLAAGGTQADICADHGTPEHHQAQALCDACVLLGAALLPGASGLALRPVHGGTTGLHLGHASTPVATLDHARASRAPPAT